MYLWGKPGLGQGEKKEKEEKEEEGLLLFYSTFGEQQCSTDCIASIRESFCARAVTPTGQKARRVSRA